MSAPKESAAAVGLMSLFTKAPKDVSPPREVHPNPTPPPGRLPTPAVAPPVPVQRSTSTTVPATGGPAPTSGLGIPGMIRTTSQTRGVSTSAPNGNVGDWRSFVAIEERTHVRSQIREAYKKNCPDYATLLSVVSAIDEELLFSNATARIDYFKAGIDWDGRLTLKRRHLAGQVGAIGAATAAAAAAANTTTSSFSSTSSPVLSTMPVSLPVSQTLGSLPSNLSSLSSSAASATNTISGSSVSGIGSKGPGTGVTTGSGSGKPRSGKGSRKRMNDSAVGGSTQPHSPNSTSSVDSIYSSGIPGKGLSSVDNIGGSETALVMMDAHSGEVFAPQSAVYQEPFQQPHYHQSNSNHSSPVTSPSVSNEFSDPEEVHAGINSEIDKKKRRVVKES